MKISYKCPICRATNELNEEDTICRRCNNELKNIYELKRDLIYNVFKNILNHRSQ